MMMLQVPGDGMRAIIESFAAELFAQLDDQINRALSKSPGAGARPARPRLECGISFGPVPRDQPRYPRLGNPIGARYLGLAAAFDDDGGDD
jgi:hypothetical protein